MTLSNRIKIAMDAADMKQADLARACGVKPPSVSGWLSGKAKFLRGENLLKVARALNVDQEWLASGRGTMTAAVATSAEASVSESPFKTTASPFIEGAMRVRIGEEQDTVPIRMVTLRLQAGATGFETEPDLHDGGVLPMPRHILEERRLEPRHLLAMRVRGQSMEPMLFEDDLVVINTADNTPISKECYAVNWNGEALLKQLVRRNGDWYLYSMNPDFGPVNVRSGQCSVVGRLIYQPGRVLAGRL
jgi:phage repressor protein C with HTH and peptisase S24 domain